MAANLRKRVGLALGGGGARGLAHIGVLSVLDEAGIPIDYLAGASAGSIIGVSYCAGVGVEKIKEYARRIRWWHYARLVWPRRGLVSFDPLRRWLVAELGDIDFADLETPFAAVATDMDTGQPVVLDRGRLAPAIQASCAVPGLVEPVEIGGRLLGDGSLSNTVPVSVLRAMGADFVIGVDIFNASIRPRWGPFGMAFTAVEILVQRAGGGIDDADCLIVPKLGGQTYHRFSARESFYTLGREAALEKLEAIRAAIGRVPAEA